MNPTNIPRRLEAVARAFPRDACPRCGGKPSRVVRVDPDTAEVQSESLPETGCPACGAPIFRCYVVDGVREQGGVRRWL
jgi:predicted RNA-binding Zn-ribbon protein involved in translation (DUF1610 family)